MFVKVRHAFQMSSTTFLLEPFVFLDTCQEKFGGRVCPRNNLSCLHCKS